MSAQWRSLCALWPQSHICHQLSLCIGKQGSHCLCVSVCYRQGRAVRTDATGMQFGFTPNGSHRKRNRIDVATLSLPLALQTYFGYYSPRFACQCQLSHRKQNQCHSFVAVHIWPRRLFGQSVSNSCLNRQCLGISITNEGSIWPKCDIVAQVTNRGYSNSITHWHQHFGSLGAQVATWACEYATA